MTCRVFSTRVARSAGWSGTQSRCCAPSSPTRASRGAQACSLPGRTILVSRFDGDPIEIGFVFQVLQAIEHLAHPVSAAMAGQHQKLVAQLGARERLLRRAFEA